MQKERKLNHITSLFDKYKKTLKAPQKVVVETFIEVVEDLVGVTVRTESVRYSVATKTLSVQVSGPLKTEIKLREKEILTHIRGRLGAGSAPVTIV